MTRRRPPPRAPASSTLTSSTTAGALGLHFPSGWDRLGEAPKIPGLVLADQVAIGPTGNDGRGIVAGMAADAGGPRLLGPGFLASLEEPPRAGDRVRLGKVEALRYEGLEPDGFGGRALTVFAAPTSAGVATIACYAPPGGGAAFRTDCERVAGTLEVEGETDLPARRRQEVRRRAQRGPRRPRQAPPRRPRRARQGAHPRRAVQGRRRAGRRRTRAPAATSASSSRAPPPPPRRPASSRRSGTRPPPTSSSAAPADRRASAARPPPSPAPSAPSQTRLGPARAARLRRGLTRGDELRVDLRGPAGDVAPVEAQDVLRRLGHEPVAQDVVAQHLLHHRRE